MKWTSTRNKFGKAMVWWLTGKTMNAHFLKLAITHTAMSMWLIAGADLSDKRCSQCW